jgi:hypothetical protein
MRDTSFYRTTFWGFGVEALPTPADREAALQAFLNWCAPLPDLDADTDGVANGLDCAPLDGTAWSEPSPAVSLTVTDDATDDLAWSPPAAPGADTVTYDVLRGEASDLGGASCLVTGIAGTVATDGTPPPAGVIHYYVVRARNACGDSLGSASSGAKRAGPACL